MRSLQILTRNLTITGGTLDRMGAHGLRGATPPFAISQIHNVDEVWDVRVVPATFAAQLTCAISQ